MASREIHRLHTDLDLQNARTRGQIVGWVQGGLVTGGMLIVVGLLGWIPAILIAVAVAFIAYRLLRR